MSTSKRVIHDVFLSFHGQDTRNNFISHLYRALRNAKINTFIDRKIPRGENISSSLIRAIKNSRIAIIVFSPNFASSTWCLNEVVKILKCKHPRGQLVLPVFFHVNPSDIRRQTGDVRLVFAKLEEKYRDDLQKVERWRSALREVADMYGWHITSTVVETEVIQQIVDEVSSNLKMLKEEDVLALQTGRAGMSHAHIINEVLGHLSGYTRSLENGRLIPPDRQAFQDWEVFDEGSSSGTAMSSCSNCADQIVKLRLHRMFQEYIARPPPMLYYPYPIYALLPPCPPVEIGYSPGETSQQPTPHAPLPYPYQYYSRPPPPPPAPSLDGTSSSQRYLGLAPPSPAPYDIYVPFPQPTSSLSIPPTSQASQQWQPSPTPYPWVLLLTPSLGTPMSQLLCQTQHDHYYPPPSAPY